MGVTSGGRGLGSARTAQLRMTSLMPDIAQGVMLAVLSSAMMAVGYVLSKEGLGDYDAVAATMIRVLGGACRLCPAW